MKQQDWLILLAGLGGAGLLLASLASAASQKRFKVGWVVLESDASPATLEQLANLELAKQSTAQAFSRYTDGLVSLDVSYPTVVSKEMVLPDSIFWVSDGLIPQFFALGHPDVFDFLLVIMTYPPPPTVAQGYYHQKNMSLGFGRPLALTTNKILGVAGPGTHLPTAEEVNMYGFIWTHEVWHHWNWWWHYKEGDLEMSDHLDGAHLSQLVRTNGRHPHYGGSWKDNGDGTWSAVPIEQATPLPEGPHNMDLYMMGLIPKTEVNPVHLLVPTEPIGPTFHAFEKIITIDQIIAIEGERRDCTVDERGVPTCTPLW